jgi:hypothetical protein
MRIFLVPTDGQIRLERAITLLDIALFVHETGVEYCSCTKIKNTDLVMVYGSGNGKPENVVASEIRHTKTACGGPLFGNAVIMPRAYLKKLDTQNQLIDWG